MPKPKKHALFPLGYDEVSLVDEGAAGSADVLIMKRATTTNKTSGGSSSDCYGSHETGAKDGKSTRSKNFDEKKHPRDKKGKMKETSKESKEKYGKGGTTKSKLEAQCRKKKSVAKKGRSTIQKSSMSTWNAEAHIRALLERKANGR
jgi:hypothetical protein